MNVKFFRMYFAYILQIGKGGEAATVSIPIQPNFYFMADFQNEYQNFRSSQIGLDYISRTIYS